MESDLNVDNDAMPGVTHSLDETMARNATIEENHMAHQRILANAHMKVHMITPEEMEAEARANAAVQESLKKKHKLFNLDIGPLHIGL